VNIRVRSIGLDKRDVVLAQNPLRRTRAFLQSSSVKNRKTRVRAVGQDTVPGEDTECCAELPR